MLLALAQRREIAYDQPIPGTEDLTPAMVIEDKAADKNEHKPTFELLMSEGFLARISDLEPIARESILLRLAGWTLEEVGERFGLNAERIRQIEVRALIQIRSQEHQQRNLAPEEVLYLRNAVKSALEAKKKERTLRWNEFRRWVIAREGKADTQCVEALCKAGRISAPHTMIWSAYWKAKSEAEFMVVRDRGSRPRSISRRLQTVLHVSWLASRVRLGLIQVTMPEVIERKEVAQVESAPLDAPPGFGKVLAFPMSQGETVAPERVPKKTDCAMPVPAVHEQVRQKKKLIKKGAR